MAKNLGGIIDIDLGWDNWMKESKRLDGSYVDVGIFPDAGNHPGGSTLFHTAPAPRHVAQIAFWQEFGTKKTPSRSFMRSTLIEQENEIRQQIIKGLNKINSRKGKSNVLLKQIGLKLKGKIKQKIISIKRPRNAPLTVKLKGFDDPLLDTRTMLNSIKFKTFFKNASLIFKTDNSKSIASKLT